ncbi:hypothetical protein SDC9_20793 [bioreactor metagenome]|uniref:Uncharacterized protein n=1 Tax=bioreactor metagenome TaxID=1076179 RepID=A0A644U7Q2_9ZZZZ|nr:hypothetical protein [Desulfitobacterium hafniense]MEA5024570.1 hypothetical protein [Desulfitobacterium hafniense]
MVNKNVFNDHFRLMTPVELCLCMDNEELIKGVNTLEPEERFRFIREFDRELGDIVKRYQEIKARNFSLQLQKD